MSPQLRGADGAAGAEDPQDRGAGRRVGAGREAEVPRRPRRPASPAGSSSPMRGRLPPRCSPPGGKRRSCPGRTAGERRRPRALSSGCRSLPAAGRNLGAEGRRDSSLRGSLRVCGSHRGSLGLGSACLSPCGSLWLPVSVTLQGSVTRGSVCSFVSSWFSLCKVVFSGVSLLAAPYLSAGQ